MNDAGPPPTLRPLSFADAIGHHENVVEKCPAPERVHTLPEPF